MQAAPSSRLGYLDWLRGFGAAIMLQGHAFHSFTQPQLREGGPYLFSQWLGGMPPAIFLFLTGMTLAFLMDTKERQGLAAGARVYATLKRARYLFLIAFLFRVQLWAFAWPKSPWTDLFRVDILNCMGFSVALLSLMALFRTAERVRFCAILGLGIAVASPLMSQVNWSAVPPILRSYLAPDYESFGFFPWGSFLAFGISAGSLLRILNEEQMERAMQWAALLGLALVWGAQSISNLGYSLYPKSDFWLDSPWLILIKLGVILLFLAFAFVWTRHAGQGWSWIRQFGVTSLLVYWVHIELVYGRWLWFWKENLNVGQTMAAAVALIVVMLIISTAKTQYRRWLSALAGARWYSIVPPKRASGD